MILSEYTITSKDIHYNRISFTQNYKQLDKYKWNRFSKKFL